MKPEIEDDVELKLEAPEHVKRGHPIALSFALKNHSRYALNGTQVVVTLPEGVSFDFVSAGTATVHGHEVVVSLGRTLPGQRIELEIDGHVSPSVSRDTTLSIRGLLRSSTALPVAARSASVRITDNSDDDDRER
jgi:hypothetical protein